MPIRTFKCTTCEQSIRTLMQDIPHHCGQPMKKLLVAPSTKMMEPRDKFMGKSAMKDQDKILMERAKEDSRKNDYAEFALESGPQVAEVQGWIGSDGRTKKKIETK